MLISTTTAHFQNWQKNKKSYHNNCILVILLIAVLCIVQIIILFIHLISFWKKGTYAPVHFGLFPPASLLDLRRVGVVGRRWRVVIDGGHRRVVATRHFVHKVVRITTIMIHLERGGINDGIRPAVVVTMVMILHYVAEVVSHPRIDVSPCVVYHSVNVAKHAAHYIVFIAVIRLSFRLHATANIHQSNPI